MKLDDSIFHIFIKGVPHPEHDRVHSVCEIGFSPKIHPDDVASLVGRSFAATIVNVARALKTTYPEVSTEKMEQIMCKTLEDEMLQETQCIKFKRGREGDESEA